MNLRSIVGTRVAVGLLQGLALSFLYSAAEAHIWPASHGVIFAPAILIIALLPLAISAGLGDMRQRTLIIWPPWRQQSSPVWPSMT